MWATFCYWRWKGVIEMVIDTLKKWWLLQSAQSRKQSKANESDSSKYHSKKSYPKHSLNAFIARPKLYLSAVIWTEAACGTWIKIASNCVWNAESVEHAREPKHKQTGKRVKQRILFWSRLLLLVHSTLTQRQRIWDWTHSSELKGKIHTHAHSGHCERDRHIKPH